MKKLFFFLMMMISFSLAAQEKMRIAIMDLEPKDMSASDAGKISELIRNEMINTGKYTVIERAQMNTLLKEQGFQQAGCTDVSCAVEMGKLMSARKILVGSVMKLGAKIILTGRIVDIEKGVAEFSEKSTANDQDHLSEAVSDFVARLSTRIGIPVDARRDGKSTPTVLYSNPFTVPAFGFLGLTALSIGGGYYMNMKVASLNSDYDSLSAKYRASASISEATALHDKMSGNRDDAKKNVLYRNVAYGVGGASLIATGYFMYRYLTFGTPGTAYYHDGNVFQFAPMVLTARDVPISPGAKNDGIFLGCQLTFRF